ncbi:hypothetical protein ACJJI5_15595 [Microbulbifer sp. EKSA008]|uniref:hypothetical protein n=1 Tax=Microbulbifer sp. EKSA008 TaxID=3243367 RepID=UPI0040436D52
MRNLYAFLILMFLTGCATNPNSLDVPTQITCIQVPSGVEGFDKRGWEQVEFRTTLQPGPYISEREDSQGIYYRAPQGGVFVGRDDMLHKPSSILTYMTWDGGIWIPKNVNEKPRIYNYFSTSSAEVKEVEKGVLCENATVSGDLDAEGVSAVSFTKAGKTSNSSLSAGQTEYTGSRGSVIGGLVVSSLINMDVGKITFQPELEDEVFIQNLRNLAKGVVILEHSTAVEESE